MVVIYAAMGSYHLLVGGAHRCESVATLKYANTCNSSSSSQMTGKKKRSEDRTPGGGDGRLKTVSDRWHSRAEDVQETTSKSGIKGNVFAMLHRTLSALHSAIWNALL